MRLIQFLEAIDPLGAIQDEGDWDPSEPRVYIYYKGYRKRAVKPARARNDVLVTVPTGPFDEAFKRGGESWYTGPGGTGATISDRYPRFQEWIEQHKTYEVPEVHVDKRGIVSFTNGRHRYSVLRDDGVDPMPVAMDREGLRNAQAYGLIASINEGEIVEEEEIETAPAVYKDLIKHVEEGDLSTLIEKLNKMSSFDVSIFLSHVRKYLGEYVMQDIIQYWQSSIGVTESLTEAMLAEQTKCGVMNALVKYRPDLQDEFEKLPPGKVNSSILFLQDYGLWDDKAQDLARRMAASKKEMDRAKFESDFTDEERKSWFEGNREAYFRLLKELMCYAVRLIKDSQDPSKRLQPYRTDKPE